MPHPTALFRAKLFCFSCVKNHQFFLELTLSCFSVYLYLNQTALFRANLYNCWLFHATQGNTGFLLGVFDLSNQTALFRTNFCCRKTIEHFTPLKVLRASFCVCSVYLPARPDQPANPGVTPGDSYFVLYPSFTIPPPFFFLALLPATRTSHLARIVTIGGPNVGLERLYHKGPEMICSPSSASKRGSRRTVATHHNPWKFHPLPGVDINTRWRSTNSRTNGCSKPLPHHLSTAPNRTRFRSRRGAASRLRSSLLFKRGG